MTKKGYSASLSQEEKDRLAKIRRERYQDPEFRRKAQSAYTKHRYGITIDDRDLLLEAQGGVCAICGGENQAKRGWHIDHDHDTGKVRGILCGHCNVMLGHARDNIDTLLAGVEYLRKHKEDDVSR